MDLPFESYAAPLYHMDLEVGDSTVDNAESDAELQEMGTTFLAV